MKSFTMTPTHYRDELTELLAMALNAVIAEFLDLEVDRVQPNARLTADLDMTPIARRRLQREIAFLFDCTEIDMPDAMRVGELIDQVADIEFARLP